MKDDDLEAYVDAIERHFRARRGAEHVLTPRDFALARSWHRAGIPLATVLVGLDAAFDAGQQATSLAYCRQRVEALAAAGPRQPPEPAQPAERMPLPELCELLESLLERLLALRPGPEACFEPPLRRLQEVRDLLSVAARPNWDFLRRKLDEIDADVSAAALQALSEDQLAALQREAERAVVRHRGRVAEAALDDARARFVMLRARERLGLPRASLA
jgi:hypothetical protein